jgi:hypothetical protein
MIITSLCLLLFADYYDYGTPNELKIFFHDFVQQEDIDDFLLRYQEYDLQPLYLEFTDEEYYHILDNTTAGYFSFNCDIITNRDLLGIIREDEIVDYVEYVGHYYFDYRDDSGYFSLYFSELTENGEIDELFNYLIIEFSIFNIENNGIFQGTVRYGFYYYMSFNMRYQLFYYLREVSIIKDISSNEQFMNNTDKPIEKKTIVTVYPNPVSGNNISFKSTLKDSHFELSIYNIKGQLVKKTNSFQKNIDEYLFTWNRKDDNNNTVSNGIYFYKIKTKDSIHTGKFLI